jgi:hypothetical protein
VQIVGENIAMEAAIYNKRDTELLDDCASLPISFSASAAAPAAAAFRPNSSRGFDNDADTELRDRSRWGDPMAGKLKKKKGGDGFDLPAPLITEANRAMMEASGETLAALVQGLFFVNAAGAAQRLGLAWRGDECNCAGHLLHSVVGFMVLN